MVSMIRIDYCGEDKLCDILPAWFIGRMSSDSWPFGLMMISGDIIVVDHINSISSDGKWIDCEMWESHDKFTAQGKSEFNNQKIEDKILTSPTERTTCSIQVEHIMAAFELAYT